MPSQHTSTPYFQADSLRSGFTASIKRALSAGNIADQEYQALRKLLSPDNSDDLSSSGLRVDRLITEDGPPISDEWVGALLISPANPQDTHLYLDTLFYGLERFEDRDTLLAALNRHLPTGATPTFEYQLIEDQLFSRRMETIVDQQAEHLRQLASRLQRIPSLESALTRALQLKIPRVLPGANIDLSVPLVQNFRVNKSTFGLTEYTQTLTQAAMDVLVGKPLPTDLLRSYLDSRGRVVDTTRARVYDQLLSEAVKGLTSVYESLLSDYWQRPNALGQTPRTLTAQALAAGLRWALLNSRHQGLLDADEFASIVALLQPTKSLSKSSIRAKRLSLIIGNQQPVKLVGLVLMVGGQLPDLILYSALHGIRRFAGLQALAEHFATAAGRIELQLHVSLNDAQLLDKTGAMRIDAYDIEHSLFIDCMDSIIALQKRNLGYVLDCAFTDGSFASAMVDDALDIGHLIDRRLALCDGGGRWLEGNRAYAQRWQPASSSVASETSTSPVNTHNPQLIVTWTEQITALEKQVQWLNHSNVGIETCAGRLLNEYLALLGEPTLDASQVFVSWADSARGNQTSNEVGLSPQASIQPTRPMKLIDLLLEKVSGYRSGSIPQDASVFRSSGAGQPSEPFTLLSVEFINQIFERVTPRLVATYLSEARAFCFRPLRAVQQQLVPAAVANRFWEDALRLECDLEARVEGSEPEHILMLEQVLNRPVRSQRESLYNDIVEVYSAALDYADQQAPAPLSNFFILRQPLRTQERVMCWSALYGMELFDSLEMLGLLLNKRLAASPTREAWLGLFGAAHRQKLRKCLEQPGRATLTLQYTRIDDHFIQALQQIEHQRRHSNVEQALHAAMHCSMSATLLARFTSVAETDERMSCVLDGLLRDIKAAVLQGMLPPWLQAASAEDLGTYIDLLTRHYLTNDPAEDFLANIPSLQAFAREQVSRRLNTDYPGQLPDPDEVTVTFTSYVPALVPLDSTPSSVAAATVVNRETLTEFALNHFDSVQGAVLVVSLSDGLPLPDFVSSGYFKALVRELDVGQQYRALLAAKLDEHSQNYALSRTRFIAQIPPRMLLLAFEMKLQNQLSAKAYEYLQNLLDMPDGIARQPVDGEQVTLRPMLLLAEADMTPDPVSGVYLIGPRDESKGPLIVHVLFNEAFSFKEFASKDELMLALQSPGSLQTLVLGRVDPLVRKRYDHGGFREVHIPWSTEGFLAGPDATPGPPSLVGSPVSGNILQFLFVQTLSVLKDICRKQTVTTAEADWTSFVQLMRLGVEQVISFWPGKLGLLLAAWQSQNLLKASAVSAYDRRWGRALSEFTAALGMLLSNRRSAEIELQNAETQVESRPAALEEPGFSWKNSSLTPELKTRLRAFQVPEIILSNLQHDSLYNLYKDPHTLKQYAAIAGQVYQVRPYEGQWRIVGVDGQGPLIRLNAEQQWELSLGLMGGGGSVTRFQSAAASDSVERILIVEAEGMSEIRMLYEDRASKIVEATVQARRYLENCLFNLVPTKPGGFIHGYSSNMISEFFGTQWVSESQVTMVRKKAIKLYLALTDPSLSALFSRRFVVGTNRRGHEATAAFVSLSDPQKRIYLTESFFEDPDFSLHGDYLQHGSFNMAAHSRAATLIHELSHMVDNTHDIAYLDSSAPFPDLLNVRGQEEKKIKDELHELRTSALSHRTPEDRLFRKPGETGWRDITEKNGLQSVLRLTKTTTLSAARAAFFSDARIRSEVILSNADSLTVLLMQLGRKRMSPDFSFNESVTSLR